MLSKKVVGEREMDNDENLNHSAGNKRILFRPSSIIFRPSWTARLTSKGQVMIEFTFCMIIVFLMMYAVLMVFRWTGRDPGRRQKAHEDLLRSTGGGGGNPQPSIAPYFYTPEPMKAVWNGD